MENVLIKITLNTFTQDYQAFYTNAPRGYDYSYCIPIQGDNDPSKDSRRIVLIPVNRLDYQTGRYASGLYQFEACDAGEMPDSAIIELLHERLVGLPLN